MARRKRKRRRTGRPQAGSASASGGSGGEINTNAPVRYKQRQCERARGARERRLERLSASGRLRVVRESESVADGDVRSALAVLRDGLAAKEPALSKDGSSMTFVPDNRERRLSADTLLRHHREVFLKEKPVESPGDSHLHLHAGEPAWIRDPSKRAEVSERTRDVIEGRLEGEGS